MVRFVLACLLFAGTASADVPGQRWITPPQPWRVSTSTNALAIYNNDALVGGFNGWIGRVELATGQVVQSTRVGLQIYSLTVLADGRVLVLGKRADKDTALALDPRTFEVTQLAMPDHWSLAEVAVLPEGVVFAGGDLPLALWDPVTWMVRRILDPNVGWASPVVSNGAVLATHEDRIHRFEWTGKHTPVGKGDAVAAGGDAIARRFTDDVSAGKMGVEVDHRGKLAFTIESRFVNEMAIDPSGKRLTVYDSDGVLEVFEIPSGRSLHRPRLDHGGVSEIAVLGPRVVLAAGRVVRVLDGRDGSLTSTGTGPMDQPWNLVVDNAGTVVASTRYTLYSFASGAITTTIQLGGDTFFTPPRGEVTRFAGGDNHLVAISTIADRSVRSWKLEASMSSGWFDRDRMVVETSDATTRRLVRGDQNGLHQLLAIDNGGTIHDVDLRTERALVSFDGSVYPVSLRDGSRSAPISAPGCTGYLAQLAPGGRDFSIFDDHQIVVTDGTSVMSTRFSDDEIYRVEHVPDRDELVIALERRTVLWSPRARTLREIPLSGVTALALSPDGKRIAFALADARTLVADLDTLRSAIAATETRSYEPAAPKCRVAKFATAKDP